MGKSNESGPGYASFLRTPGLSIHVAARDQHNAATLARAVGFRLSSNRKRVTILVPANAAAEVLANIRANGAVAAVFTKPSTHATLQLKGADAAVGKPLRMDPEIVAEHRKNFVLELGNVGFSRPFTETLMDCDPGDLATITFTPYAVYSQTPGPTAGEPQPELR